RSRAIGGSRPQKNRRAEAALSRLTMEQRNAEELVRRLAAALRATELYAPNHPLIQRGIDALNVAAAGAPHAAPPIVVSFIGDEIVVDAGRLQKGSATLAGLARDLRERDVEKVTFARGVSKEDLRVLVGILSDRKTPGPLPDRLALRGVRHITLGR